MIYDEENESEEAIVRVIRHPFVLRKNLTIELYLPIDVTEHEAERIARWVKVLPVPIEIESSNEMANITIEDFYA